MIDKNISRLANICTILGFLYGIFSQNIFAIILFFIIILIESGVYLYFKFRKHGLAIKKKKIELVTLLSPINKNDNTLALESIEHKSIIEREKAEFIYTYEGTCTATRGEECIVFNIGAEEYIPFKELKCYAYDLVNDKKKSHMIKPELVGDDGLTKKVKIKFIKKLKQYDHFKIEFVFVFPHCVKFGRDYVTFTTSYSKRIHRLNNILIFKKSHPTMVELHKVSNDIIKYEKTIFPQNQQKNIHDVVYKDFYEECPGKQVFVYFFDRDFPKER